MSVVLTICLPLETVRAIQGGEVASVLKEFSTVSTGPYHLVHDITRSVVTAVNVVPYNITPKTSPAESLELAHDFSTTSPNDGIKWPSYPAPSFVQPLGSSVPGSEIFGKVESPPHYINLTIRDLMNNEEHIKNVSPRQTFQYVADIYGELKSCDSADLIFTYEDWEMRMVYRLGDYGIRNGAVILVKPKQAVSVDTVKDIVVIIQDSMKREESFAVKAATSFRELKIMYKEATGLERSSLDFFFEDEKIGMTDENLSRSLTKMGIVTGSIIKVSVAAEVPLTLTFRDQMLNEETITLCDVSWFTTYIYEYQNRKGAKFCYSVEDSDHMGSGDSWRWDTLEDLGITDGSIINVHPIRKTAKVARAESVVSLATVSTGRTRKDDCGGLGCSSGRSLCWE